MIFKTLAAFIVTGYFDKNQNSGHYCQCGKINTSTVMKKGLNFLQPFRPVWTALLLGRGDFQGK